MSTPKHAVPRDKSRERTASAIAGALSLISHSPDRSARILAGAMGKLAKTTQQRMISDWVLDWAQPGSPGAEYLQRLTNNIHPNVRKRFLAGFITDLVFRNDDVYEELMRTRGIKSPTILAISPSMRCNLRCTGCYAGSYDRKDDLDEETVERLICEAEAINTRFFIIIGGEPFMWPPFLDIVERHPYSVFQPYTNATLITDEVADRIVRLGNIAPAISIEGLRERTDARRGAGTYDKVIAAMDRLRERGAMFAFSATATRENLDEILSDEFVDLMIEKGALYGWYFSYAPVGLNPDLSYMPTPQERDKLRRGVNRLRQEKPILLADFWNDGALTGGCISAGREYLHINNKGDVEPCVFCHFAVDNVRDTPLVDALASPFFRDIRRLQPFGHNLLRPCPLIDHPAVIRRLVERNKAYPTHPGAESLVTSLQPGLHQYAAKLRDIYTPVWNEEYSWAEGWLEQVPEYQRRIERGADAEADLAGSDQTEAGRMEPPATTSETVDEAVEVRAAGRKK